MFRCGWVVEQVLALENALTRERKIPHIKSVKHKSWCLVKTQESVWFGRSGCQRLQCQGLCPPSSARIISKIPSAPSVSSHSCPARHSRLVPLSFPEQVTFNSTESFPFPLPGGGPCIKTERGRPHRARRPGWPGNPGTPRCCRWRGRSSVHSRPGPSWTGAPLVRSVP